jgi:hypothetical protein
MDKISACHKKLVAGLYFVVHFSLNWKTRYKTYRRNWRPATTTYWTLAPRYKSKADSENFGPLIAGH